MRVLFLKSLVTKQIEVPAYYRKDGTFVPEHNKNVRVSLNMDHPVNQRMARKIQRTHRNPPAPGTPEHTLLVHAYAHDHTRAAANRVQDQHHLQGWRMNRRVQRDPTERQWEAFHRASDEDRRIMWMAFNPSDDAPPPRPLPAIEDMSEEQFASTHGTFQAVVEDNISPPAEPLPRAQQAAVRNAMAEVPEPDISRLSDSPTNQGVRRRLTQLRELAVAGDIDAVTNFSTSRTRANYRIVDDYRTALLAEAHREIAPPAPSTPVHARPIPEPPTITGRNMQNVALVRSQGLINILHAAAVNFSNPIPALLEVHTYRGNSYANAADNYRTALLAHFGYALDGTTTTEAALHTPAPAPAAAPAPAPAASAPAAAPRRRRSAPAAARPSPNATLEERLGYEIGGVPLEQLQRDRHWSANPEEKSPQELGFVPRPNVPLDWTMTNGGFTIEGEIVPYRHPVLRQLVAAYLAQPTSKQLEARNLQSDNVASVRASRHSLLLEHRSFARAQAAGSQAAMPQWASQLGGSPVPGNVVRQATEAQRAAGRAFLDKLAALPALHQPTQTPGHNVHSISGDLTDLCDFTGLDEDAANHMLKQMICEYGTYRDGSPVKFKISVSGTRVAFYACKPDGSMASGDKEVTINRTFVKRGGVKYVSHDLFTVAKVRNDRGNLVTNSRGGAKGFFRTAIGIYKSLGIHHVSVHANIDVGGYCWAKFGFKIRQDSWDYLRESLKRKIERIETGSGQLSGTNAEGEDVRYPLSPKAKKALKALLDDAHPTALWKLSDMKDNGVSVGKMLLLGTGWYGDLEIGETDTYRRCLGYIVDANRV